jgi:dienelactone hydrolase
MKLSPTPFSMVTPTMVDFTNRRPLFRAARAGLVFFILGIWIALPQSVAATNHLVADVNSPVTVPIVSLDASPLEELHFNDTSYAVIRKPPGNGPFPAVIILHGGLAQASMPQLKRIASEQPTATRFLAWGYLTVNATRRSIRRDPQDRGVLEDTLPIIEAIKLRADVDPQSVVLYGGSGGGTLALEMARKVNLSAVVAWEPATIMFMGMFTKEHVDTDASGKVTGDRRWDVMNLDPETLYTPAVKQHTRDKIAEIRCPVLILHGDQHPLVKFNLRIFVPELLAMGKTVMVVQYPGEEHGFYWGRSQKPEVALKANRDADAFIRSQIATPPRAIADSFITHHVAEPTKPAD